MVSEYIIGFGGSLDDSYDVYAFTEVILIFIADYLSNYNPLAKVFHDVQRI